MGTKKPNRKYLVSASDYVEWLQTRTMGQEASGELRSDFLRDGLATGS